MVNLKPANKKDQQTPTVENRRGFHRQWLFVLASVLLHGLLLLLFVAYQRLQPVVEEKPEENKPIDFVVIPEEESEEPPEADILAPENSVAQNSTESEETTVDEEAGEVAPSTIEEPISEGTAALSPEPVPEPEPELEPEASTDVPLTKSPKPELEATPQPEPEPSVATNSPPTQPELPQTTTTPSQPTEDSGASALLGGDYQQSLANGGGDAFFSEEALTFKSVLSPGQLNALKDIDLGAYHAEMGRKFERNWNPSYRVNEEEIEEYATLLAFNIEKNGQITELKIIKSSGSPEVDREFLDLVQKSAPFAPLPPEFPLEALEVRFSFNFYIN